MTIHLLYVLVFINLITPLINQHVNLYFHFTFTKYNLMYEDFTLKSVYYIFKENTGGNAQISELAYYHLFKWSLYYTESLFSTKVHFQISFLHRMHVPCRQFQDVFHIKQRYSGFLEYTELLC